MAQFNIGDNAVYAGSGVGRIIAIETKELCGIKQTFYRFQLFNSNVSALVPVNSPESKLRPIISKDEADRVTLVSTEALVDSLNRLQENNP